ncbi:ribonuclease H-like domain-containing protein [Tanacetum coccineum]
MPTTSKFHICFKWLSIWGEADSETLTNRSRWRKLLEDIQIHCLFLSQATYVEELLERGHMKNCNPCRTHVDTDTKLSPDDDPVSDPTLYRSLADALHYLTLTHPDLDNFLSWSAKRQAILSKSSAEVEYRGVVNVIAETA